MKFVILTVFSKFDIIKDFLMIS